MSDHYITAFAEIKPGRRTIFCVCGWDYYGTTRANLTDAFLDHYLEAFDIPDHNGIVGTIVHRRAKRAGDAIRADAAARVSSRDYSSDLEPAALVWYR